MHPRDYHFSQPMLFNFYTILTLMCHSCKLPYQNQAFNRWWEVTVLSRITTTPLIKQLELACIVHRTKQKMYGFGYENNEEEFEPQARHYICYMLRSLWGTLFYLALSPKPASARMLIFFNAWHFCYLLPSLWKGDLKKMHESKRNRCMKEKEQQKLSVQNAQTSLCCCFKFHQVISYYFDQQLYKQ